jgi:hypothetical protein
MIASHHFVTEIAIQQGSKVPLSNTFRSQLGQPVSYFHHLLADIRGIKGSPWAFGGRAGSSFDFRMALSGLDEERQFIMCAGFLFASQVAGIPGMRCFSGASNSGSIPATRASVRASRIIVFATALQDQTPIASILANHSPKGLIQAQAFTVSQRRRSQVQFWAWWCWASVVKICHCLPRAHEPLHRWLRAFVEESEANRGRWTCR